MKKPIRLLVVDDDPNILGVFSDILRDDGYEAWGAATGQEGLELVREKRPDLVLLDVGLPDMSGHEVCRQIKADAALLDTLVVMISGAARSPKDKVRGLDSGADDYILKSTEWEEIRARIRTVVRLREATAALRAREQHYRGLVEILPEGVSIIDLEGRLLEVNSQAAAMLGYEGQAELMQKSAFDFTPPEEHERVKANIATVLKDGVLRDVEAVVLRKNGERFPIELSLAVLRDPRSPPSALVCVWRDVSRRKQTEEKTRLSIERFRQIAENIREVFWMTDVTKNQMIYISPGYEEIWGQSCESLYASPKNWVESLHPDDRERVLEAAQTKQVGGQYDEVYRIVRPDGSIRWIQDRAFPIRDESGKVYRIAGIGEDITKRRQAEVALRESEARKGAMMQAALDGIVTIDHKGRIIEVNFAAEKIFGYAATSLIGQELSSVIIPPSLQHWFQLGLASSFAVDEGPILGSRIEITALRVHHVEFPVEFTITRIEKGGPPAFIAFFRDISGRMRTETKLATLVHAIETTTEPVYITDFKDRVTFVNRAFLKTYGYAEGEILTKSAALLDAPGNPPGLQPELQARSHSGGWRGEVRHRRRDGTELPVFLIISQIKDRTSAAIGLMHVAQDMTERKRAEVELRQLPRRIIAAQEAERLRVARDLHDGVNQVIASVKMRLRNVGEIVADPAAREILVRCEKLLLHAIEENRRIARNLRPSDLDEFGLVAACRNFCKELRLRVSQVVKCSVSRQTRRLPHAVELDLFRIVQEAVNNVEKHAEAKTLRLRITFQADSVMLRIQDDGRGFDAGIPRKGGRKRRGIGLTNMRERAASLGGTCEISSKPGKGTVVTVKAPSKQEG